MNESQREFISRIEPGDLIYSDSEGEWIVILSCDEDNIMARTFHGDEIEFPTADLFAYTCEVLHTKHIQPDFVWVSE